MRRCLHLFVCIMIASWMEGCMLRRNVIVQNGYSGPIELRWQKNTWVGDALVETNVSLRVLEGKSGRILNGRNISVVPSENGDWRHENLDERTYMIDSVFWKYRNNLWIWPQSYITFRVDFNGYLWVVSDAKDKNGQSIQPSGFPLLPIPCLNGETTGTRNGKRGQTPN